MSPRGDSGSATLELVVLAAVLLLLFGMVIAAGRIVGSSSAVEQAAAAAARQASLSRNSADAKVAAVAVARDQLERADLHCLSTDIRLDTRALSGRVGRAGVVTATVSCQVDLNGLRVPGLAVSRAITSTASSPVDRFRAR